MKRRDFLAATLGAAAVLTVGENAVGERKAEDPEWDWRNLDNYSSIHYAETDKYTPNEVVNFSDWPIGEGANFYLNDQFVYVKKDSDSSIFLSAPYDQLLHPNSVQARYASGIRGSMAISNPEEDIWRVIERKIALMKKKGDVGLIIYEKPKVSQQGWVTCLINLITPTRDTVFFM